MARPEPESYPPTARVRKRREFKYLQRAGIRKHTPHFVVIHELRNGSGACRLGVTVSKRVGNAVDRNRVKRLVREVFRTTRSRIGVPVDFLIIAKPDARKLTYAEVAAELEASILRIAPPRQ